MQSVLIGGSRNLSAQFAPLVGAVAQAVAQSALVHVGCSAGADQLALQALSPAQVQVFAAGAQSGQGFVTSSATSAVMQAAQAGAAVSWLAGGALHVPIRARLIRRSLAALAGCSQAVFFVNSAQSSGSLAVAAKAAQAGKPVFVFSCGFSGAPAPLKGCAGSWVQSSFAGRQCWQWSPAQIFFF